MKPRLGDVALWSNAVNKGVVHILVTHPQGHCACNSVSHLWLHAISAEHIVALYKESSDTFETGTDITIWSEFSPDRNLYRRFYAAWTQWWWDLLCLSAAKKETWKNQTVHWKDHMVCLTPLDPSLLALWPTSFVLLVRGIHWKQTATDDFL